MTNCRFAPVWKTEVLLSHREGKLRSVMCVMWIDPGFSDTVTLQHSSRELTAIVVTSDKCCQLPHRADVCVDFCRITDILEGMNWRRVNEKRHDNFTMKWTESKSAISFTTFREGEKQPRAASHCFIVVFKSFENISSLCRRTDGQPLPKLPIAHQQDGFTGHPAKF